MDVNIVSADVLVSGGSPSIATAAVELAAGDLIYLDGSDAYKAKSDSSEHASADGVCLCSAAAGQPVVYAASGTLTTGGIVSIGQLYVVSENAGKIAPSSDLDPGEYVTIVGIGKTTAAIQLLIVPGSVARAGS